MARPKGSKNKPKQPLQSTLEQSNEVYPSEKPKRAQKGLKRAKKGIVEGSFAPSAATEKEPLPPTANPAPKQGVIDSPNRAIIDLNTGQILGPDKSLDLSISAIPHYSHSFIRSVATCSAQAYFKKANAPQVKSFALERGSCVHNLLEAFAKEGKDPVAGLPDMWKLFIVDHLEEMTEADQEKATKEYESTKEMLEEFVHENATFFHEHIRPEDVEVEFNLDVPLRLGDKTFTRKFNGKIDLIVWNNDRTEIRRIIDYKTSASAPSSNELALDSQFALYFWAVQQMFGLKARGMDYYLLRGQHLCRDEAGRSIRFSAKAHPRALTERKPNCEVTYAIRVPTKTDDEVEELFNAYYAPLVVKYEAGIISKEGRADPRNRCNFCTFATHCSTVKEFPVPRIV